MIGAAIGLVCGVVGVAVLVREGLGRITSLLRRPRGAEGDAALSDTLNSLCGKQIRRAAVAVVDAEGVVRMATRGASADDIFEIGSISKAFTGLLLVDAEQRGECLLTDPVAEHLSELAGRPIGEQTLSELGAHRSGLPRIASGPRPLLAGLSYTILGTNPYAGQGVSFVIRAAGRARLRTTEGAMQYSNLGGALAGAVLERASGASYDELVCERLAVCVGMTRTRATPAAARRAGRSRRGAWQQQWRLTGFAPAGGVTSTIADLAKLSRALLDGSAPGAAALARNDCFWVRGGSSSGGPVVWHNGMTGGYAAYLGLWPDSDWAVIVLLDAADMATVTRIVGEVAGVGK